MESGGGLKLELELESTILDIQRRIFGEKEILSVGDAEQIGFLDHSFRSGLSSRDHS